MKKNPNSLFGFSFFAGPARFLSSPLICFLLTSLFLTLSYPKFSFGFLAWFALAPFVSGLWKIKKAGRALLYSYLSGFFFYFGILYWIYFTLRAGGVNPGFSFLGWSALSALMAFEFAAVGLTAFHFKKVGRKVFPYVFAFSWASVEGLKLLVAREALWFPWFMLGYTQWNYTSIIQPAAVFGVSFLSFAMALSGGVIGAMRPWKRKLSGEMLRLAPPLALFLAMFVYGKACLSRRPAPERAVKAVLLQPSIDFYKKWDERYSLWIEKRIENLIEKKAGTADFIIWPENALPGMIGEKKYALWFSHIYESHKAYNLVGSVSLLDERHVSAFLTGKNGKIVASYNKRKLVPFGEYVPFRDFLGKFIKPVGELGEFESGAEGQDLFRAKGVEIGVLICYESIFPRLAGEDSEKGADMLVNVTNDGWYLETAAPYQHFIVNIFRAVENRKPLLRAANNGISAYINPWGEIIGKLGLNDYGVLKADVALYSGKHRNRASFFYMVCYIITAAFVVAAVFLS